MLIHLLPLHCRLSLAEETIGRICRNEEEAPVNVWCHGDGLVWTRFLVPGVENPITHSFIEKPLSKVIGLVKQVKDRGHLLRQRRSQWI